MQRRAQQAEPFNFAATALRRRNCNTLQRRKLESDAAPLRQILLQASYSTCRNDGTAVILEFKPRLENRCSKEVKTRAIRASIPDFKPRLANRCSKEVKTRAIRASILDFKPRLANRCSQKVKTEVIPASILDFRARIDNHCSAEVKTGTSLQPNYPAAGECRMGRDFGRRSRPWLRER